MEKKRSVSATGPGDQPFRVYIGTYTENPGLAGGKSEGIYQYQMDTIEGTLSYVDTTSGVANPSFLAFHPSGRYLYAANELAEYRGQPGGGVSAFSVDPQTGALAFLNGQPSHGAATCYVSVDATGQVVLAANYGGGNLVVLPVGPDGGLLPVSDIIQHAGSSIDPVRQDKPYAHSITPDPNNKFAIAADLGLDKLMIYRLDLDHNRLAPHNPPWVAVESGAGPRHLDFHPNGRYVYLINELNSTMIVFEYEPDQGTLREIQTVPTLPEGFRGVNTSAEVRVAPSGKFVYGSNRGHDSLVIYAIDEASGRLSYVGHQSTGGKTPRNFAIDPNGSFLLAANQDSNTVVTFRINGQTGRLTPTGQVTEVPTPVCIKMA